MNGICKWTSYVTVVAFAALAIPAALAAKPPGQGQDKSYGIEFLLPSKAATGVNGALQNNPLYADGAVTGDKVITIPPAVRIVVYVKNESPPSTAASNISSLSFDLAPSLVLVAAPQCPRGICSANGNTVSVTNISPPIQAQEIFPITLQVNTCVVVKEAFIANVNVSTGSQITNGQPFKEYAGDATFQPAKNLSKRLSALGNDDFPFDFTTTVTPTDTGISCGNISCEQSFTIGNIDPSQLGYRVVTGLRGLNADGTCPDASQNRGYFVTNKLGVPADTFFPATKRSVHVVWPNDGTTTPVFAYRLTRDTDDTGTEWDLAWLPKPPSLAPVPINGDDVHCIGDGFGLGFFPSTQADPNEPAADQLPLPTVYGVLTQDVKSNTKQLKVDTGGNALPTITPPGLPIMVESERMLVTSIGSNGWAVSRTNAVFHPATTKVASTPFPILGSVPSGGTYSSGTPAQMCLVWKQFDGKAAWIIDGSDGWGLGR